MKSMPALTLNMVTLKGKGEGNDSGETLSHEWTKLKSFR